MESRKLIAFGKNSYVISLPKEWLLQNKISKGDNLFIDVSTNELKLFPFEKSYRHEQKKIVIETENKDLARIRDELISAYLMNYNLIELVGDNISDDITPIKNTIRDLSGLEIMELTSKRIVAHDILSEEEVDLYNIFRRIDMIVRSMITDTIATVNTSDGEDIVARDQEVNRLVFLAFRVLGRAISDPSFSKRINFSLSNILEYRYIVTSLENIGDQAKRIARHNKDLHFDEKVKHEFQELFELVHKVYLDVMKAHYTKNRNLCFEIIQKCKSQNVNCDKFLEAHPSVQVAHTISLLKSMNSQIKHIARYVTVSDESIKNSK